jgi:hypothetical protein
MIGAPEVAQAGAIFVEVDHIPGEPHDMFRSRAAFGQHCEHVVEQLPRLAGE